MIYLVISLILAALLIWVGRTSTPEDVMNQLVKDSLKAIEDGVIISDSHFGNSFSTTIKSDNPILPHLIMDELAGKYQVVDWRFMSNDRIFYTTLKIKNYIVKIKIDDVNGHTMEISVN